MTINLSGRVLPKFPTRVNAGVGIAVEKNGGVWSFALDYTDIGLSGSLSTGFIAVQLPDGTFGKVPASSALGLFSGAEQVKTSSYGVLPTDAGSPLIGNAAGAITFDLPPLGASTAGYLIRNIGTGTLTLDPNGAELIEGAATMALVRGQGALIWPGFDGWRAFEPAQNLLTKSNTWTAVQTYQALNIFAPPAVAGGQSVVASFRNTSGSANTEVALEFMPNLAAAGLRAAYIASSSGAAGGNNANLIFRTARGDVPTEFMRLGDGISTGATGGGLMVGMTSAGLNDQNAGTVNVSSGFFINNTNLFARANTWTAAQTISTNALGNQLDMITSEPGASGGPRLRLFRDSASPAAADTMGSLDWNGRDSGANLTIYGNLFLTLDDPTDGSEDATYTWNTIVAGTLANRWKMGGGFYYNGGTDPGTGKINVNELQISGVSIFDRANTWTAAQVINCVSANPVLTLVNQDPGSTGARLFFNHDSASPAAAEDIMIQTYQGNSSTGTARVYARMRATILDPTNTSEDAAYLFETAVAGVIAGRFRLGDGFYYNAGADPGTGNINAQTDIKIAGVSLFDRQNTFTVLQTISTTGAGGGILMLTSTDPGANSAARLTFWRNSPSPAAADGISGIEFKGNDSGLNVTDFASVGATIDDPTDGSEDGRLTFTSTIGGGGGLRWNIGAGFYYGAGADMGGGMVNALAYYRAGVQVVSARVTGYVAMTGTGNRNTVYDTATVTLAQLAGRVMSMQADLTAHGLIGP